MTTRNKLLLAGYVTAFLLPAVGVTVEILVNDNSRFDLSKMFGLLVFLVPFLLCVLAVLKTTWQAEVKVTVIVATLLALGIELAVCGALLVHFRGTEAFPN